MTTKTATKTAKKKAESVPNLTWPLPEEFMSMVKEYVKSEGVNECQVDEEVRDFFMWEEVKTLSETLKLFKPGADANCPNYNVGSGSLFVIVDTETKTVFLDAAMSGIGELIRSMCHRKYNTCSFSFNALARMMTGKIDDQFDTKGLLAIFSKSNFSVVDFAEDEIIKVDCSHNMVQKIKALKKQTKKEIADLRVDGYAPYSWGRGKWEFHRPSSVLVRLENDSSLNHFILSVDEGTYFGCMLPVESRPKTIKEAFHELVPVEFRSLEPNEYVRQGEWFFYQVSKGSKEKDREFSMQNYIVSTSLIYLPKQSEDSHDHVINSYGEEVYIIGCSDGVFKIHVTDLACVNTDDHAEVDLDAGVWEIRRNTALVSVSEEGID